MVVLTSPEISALQRISLVGTKAEHHFHCTGGDGGSSSSCCCSSSLPSNLLLKPRSCNSATSQQQIDTVVTVMDMSSGSSDNEITRVVRACEDLGFFKVTNHDFPREVISRLEEEAKAYLFQQQEHKDKSGPPNRSSPYGYGNRWIGPKGDVRWLKYLLMQVKPDGNPVLGSDSTCCSASAAAARRLHKGGEAAGLPGARDDLTGTGSLPLRITQRRCKRLRVP